MVVKVEGRVAGPWAAELDAAWKQLAPSLNARPVSLDLREVMYVDPNGMRILRRIYQETKAEFQTGSPLTRHFAEKAKSDEAHDVKEDD